MANAEYLFSSESVTEGHPDKVCDQISDAILDAYLAQDPHARVACETAAGKGIIMVLGEISSNSNTKIDIKQVVDTTIKNIGYTDPAYGLDVRTYKLIKSLSQQSPDISAGVDVTENREQGAGDQGLMFGYACDDTPELMPLPIMLAHKLTQRLAQVRKENILPWARPDGKAQVTVKYIDDKPIAITTVVVSTQHDPAISHKQITKDIKNHVIMPVCKDYLTKETVYHINPTGKFILGGPQADAGLTGRKIIVDTYGGMGRHGGGCFSGKDPSKVDRSACYMARHIAKNIVAAGIAKRCEVQIAYSIGIAEPVSLYINTFGTSKISAEKIEQAVRAVFHLKPAQLIEYLDLKRPIYLKTAAYGHFGRKDTDFTWEKTNKVDELTKELGL
ncbi:methionine adenosyltransferase [Candidatus Dependentiae bacterium]